MADLMLGLIKISQELNRSRLATVFTKLWKFYLVFSGFYRQTLQKAFAGLGSLTAKHPLTVILVSAVIVASLASGFVFFTKFENSIEKLYIPQESESITNLKKARNYGFYRPSRLTEVILLNNGDGNISTKECFQDALKLHKIITNITGYTGLCLPIQHDRSGRCTTIEPLSVFDYKSNFENLLFKLNDPRISNKIPYEKVFGQIVRDSSGRIISAKALRLMYVLKAPEFGEDDSVEITDWEKAFLDEMKCIDSLQCGPLYYTTGRSIEDAISDSMKSDIKLIAITIVGMLGFVCFMLTKYKNPVTGHGLLAVGGVFTVVFGIAAAFGLAIYVQVPFVSIVGLLPFLIVGVGIDDMFIIVDQLDRTQAHQTIVARLTAVMEHVGPSITMTTLTNVLAFAIGTTSKFPFIVYFCTYAAFAILFVFLLIVTMFVAFMTYDCKRINAGGRDILACVKVLEPSLVHYPTDEVQISNKVMVFWGQMLMKPCTKGLIMMFSISLLVLGIHGTTFINEEFERRDLARDGSDIIKFLDTFAKYFSEEYQVDLVLESGINYSDPLTQTRINNLTQIIRDNKHYETKITSWFDSFQQWSQQNNISIVSNFVPSLKQFLKSHPTFSSDILFSNHLTIQASRLYCFINQTKSSAFLRDAMTSLRKELSAKSGLPVFANSYPFIFIEQFVLILPETIRNLGLATTAILITTVFFLGNPLVIFIVLLEFVSLIFELLGLMYIWGVSLNSISMINLVMAIGFAVDYSVHIAHAFVYSRFTNPEEKVVDALSTVGASVLMGGFSTFLGMVVTAFASSEIFRIFFKMFFGIVVLGLLHGLCFLPVWLSVVCRQSVHVHNEAQMNTVTGNPQTITDLQ